MKKLLICFLLQFIILSSIFSNEQKAVGGTIHFILPEMSLYFGKDNQSMKLSRSDDPLKWQSRKKGGSIALTTVGSVLTTAGLGKWPVLLWLLE